MDMTDPFISMPLARLQEFIQLLTGAGWTFCEKQHPEQGVNNRTLVLRGGERSIVVKARPYTEAAAATAPDPHWPAYTRALFGDTPNGDHAQLPFLTQLLESYGSLPVPKSLSRAGAEIDGVPIILSEWLPGRSFDWTEHRFGPEAAAQLGDHLGRFHSQVRRKNGYGIFGGSPIPAKEWWSRFKASYRLLMLAVLGRSEKLHAIEQPLRDSLQCLAAQPAPEEFNLICVDQSPTHYLGDGAMITGFVDIEGHLWAPREWEIASIFLWLDAKEEFKSAYGAHYPWPEKLTEVGKLYSLYTALEWIYCMRFTMNDPPAAEALEQWLVQNEPWLA